MFYWITVRKFATSSSCLSAAWGLRVSVDNKQRVNRTRPDPGRHDWLMGAWRGGGDRVMLAKQKCWSTTQLTPRDLGIWEQGPLPPHASTDIRGEIATRAHIHERMWSYTLKHRLIKQHMLLFLLPGAAGGTHSPLSVAQEQEKNRALLLLHYVNVIYLDTLVNILVRKCNICLLLSLEPDIIFIKFILKYSWTLEKRNSKSKSPTMWA